MHPQKDIFILLLHKTFFYEKIRLANNLEVNAEMESMTQRNRDTFVQEIFASIATDIDFLSSFFSFGLDQLWRKKLVSLLELTWRREGPGCLYRYREISFLTLKESREERISLRS